jgi:ribosome-associated toxin RatA of RatAB toxin-antitoxin module
VHTVHRASIAAPLEAVFALARDVETWPGLLAHYRWCKVLEREPRRLVFAMGGRIRGWPARWTAIQEPRPEEGRITFRHIRGITTGMAVEWRFAPSTTGVDVTLVHDLIMQWPLIGRLVSDLIVGPIFIEYIARKTLQAIQAQAEAAIRTAGARRGGD